MKKSQKAIISQIETYFNGLNDTIISNTLSVSDFLSRCKVSEYYVIIGADEPILVSNEHLDLKVVDFLFDIDKVIFYV